MRSRKGRRPNVAVRRATFWLPKTVGEDSGAGAAELHEKSKSISMVPRQRNNKINKQRSFTRYPTFIVTVP